MAIASASQVSSSEHQHGSCHPHKSIQSCMYLPMWSSIHPPQPPTHELPFEVGVGVEVFGGPLEGYVESLPVLQVVGAPHHKLSLL